MAQRGEIMADKSAVLKTDISGLKRISRGKVRDIYDIGDNLLIVTTDRISAFDVILPTPIPEKGKILTEISKFWFEYTSPIIKNHLEDESALDALNGVSISDEIKSRSMLVKKAKPLPIEAVVRGYLSGSGWKEYAKNKSVCGIQLGDNLIESSRLPKPIFTPATKAAVGEHDENITFGTMCDIVGRKMAEKVRDVSISLYESAAQHALARGLIIADTKFEFGMLNGQLILIDEVVTPDSSRFWPLSSYHPGGPQPSFDKQFVRDWLERSGWNKEPPAPELPSDVVKKTAEKYHEAARLLLPNA